MSVIDTKRRIDAGLPHRRRVVAVIGSGRTAVEGCAEIGRLIAELGHDLLTGGGGGAMEAASRAFFETTPRRGLVIGVVPALDRTSRASFSVLRASGAVHLRSTRHEARSTSSLVDYDVPEGYPNKWVELAIYTHLPDSGSKGTLRSSRNHINVLSADAIVALPGREGTASEIWLATQYGVPIIAWGDQPEGVVRGIRLAKSLDEVRDFLVENI